MDIKELSSMSQNLADLREMERIHRIMMTVFSVLLIGIAVARLLKHK
jgi:hypothetical protein